MVDENLQTKQKLLNISGEIFAKKGFKDTTIREICEQARTNVASVNYHFRDKEGLYKEVLKYGLKVAIEKYPPQADIGEHSMPEEKLYAFIRSLIFRILDRGEYAWHGKLMALEMVKPTKALDDLVGNTIHPMTLELEKILREITGPDATGEELRLCMMSVVGQCMFYMHCRPVIDRLYPEQKYDKSHLENLAGHIARFSLKALKDFHT